VSIIIEIRFHGRGGQGAVTSAEVLAKAAGLDNKFSQAFPNFGPERRGAPVRAYCRIDDQPITTRSQVYAPDYVVVLDHTLAGLAEVGEGLRPGSKTLVNSTNPVKAGSANAVTYDATKLALELMGKPIVNTAMLGALANMTGMVSIGSLKKAVGNRFPGKVGEMNQKLVGEAYERFGDERK